MPDTVASIAISHILQHLEAKSDSRPSPLFVGLQGPQGSGKTTLARALVAGLESASLRVATLSIDDLYLDYDTLQIVGQENPGNGLLQGRGLPGTHDLQLGMEILRNLSSMGRNFMETGSTAEIRIPLYDKSLHKGLGDRAPVDNWPVIQPPVDVVILEGWCFGFQPLSAERLIERWEQQKMPTSVLLEHGIEDIKVVNESLKGYADAWYSYFTCFIQVAPTTQDGLGVIYKWRLQQEHAMKASNGGQGMADEDVARFIDRYIPGYLLFDGPSTHQESNLRPWHGSGLKILVDEDRRPVSTERF